MVNAKENQKKLQNLVLQKNLAHAYLFIGEKGTGKQETAEQLAKSLFCENLSATGQACGKCRNCFRISNKNHPDVEFIEPDGRSIKVEQIQTLRENFNLRSAEGGNKFYCIENADLMTSSAFNRLLTFLEEPPKNTYAVLTTTRLEMIIPTILSRCQPIYFTTLIPSLFTAELEKQGISEKQAQVLSYLTNNIKEAQELVTDTDFLEQLKVVDQWFKLLIKQDSRAFLFVQQQIISVFKERVAYQLLFDILLIKCKQEFVDFNEVAKKIIAEVTKAKIKIDHNVTPQNVCEQLALHIIDLVR